MKPDSKARLFAQVPVLEAVLRGLDPGDVRALEDGVEWVGVPGGTVLFSQGDDGHAIYVLRAGRLGVFVDGGHGPRLVHHIAPGEIVGEMAMIAHEARSATIMAIRDSEVLRIPAAAGRQRCCWPSAPFMAFLLGAVRAAAEGDHGRGAADGIGTRSPPDGGRVHRGGCQPATSADRRPHRGRPGASLSCAIARRRDRRCRRRPRACPMRAPACRSILRATGLDGWAARAMRQADRILFVAAGRLDRPDERTGGADPGSRQAGKTRRPDAGQSGGQQACVGWPAVAGPVCRRSDLPRPAWRRCRSPPDRPSDHRPRDRSGARGRRGRADLPISARCVPSATPASPST